MNIVAETPKVLLVDDDPSLGNLLGRFFSSEGFDFQWRPNAVNLTSDATQLQPSIIILDLMMPVVDGLSALKALRNSGNTTPVIMLTARADDIDRIVGLELGADDYIGKPFMPQELLVRVRAILRRISQPATQIEHVDRLYSFGGYELNRELGTLTLHGLPVRITDTEFELLSIFAAHPMRTLSRTHLTSLWCRLHPRVKDRGIDLPIFRLRRVIEENPAEPRIIQTIRGIGYVFVPPETGSSFNP